MTVARATVNVDIFDAFDTFKQAHDGVSDEVVHVFLSHTAAAATHRGIALLVVATLSSRR